MAKNNDELTQKVFFGMIFDKTFTGEIRTPLCCEYYFLTNFFKK